MIVAILCLSMNFADPARMPPALETALNNRTMDTLDVHYTRSIPDDPRGAFTWRSRYVRGDVLEEALGDVNGFVDSPKQRGLPFACSPQITLYSATSSEMWYYHSGDQQTRVTPLYEWPSTVLSRVDPRAFGMTARSQTSDDLDSVAFASKTKTPNVQYTSYTTRDLPGRLVEITGHLPEFDFDHKWVLDPAKGFNPVRCEIWEKGALAQFSETELAQYDGGTWFPNRTDFYTRGELVESVEVLRARINHPDNDKPLTPEDMGLCDGVVIERGPNRPGVIPMPDGTTRLDMKVTRWAHGQELSRADFHAAVRAGLLDDAEYYRLGRELVSQDGAGRFPASIDRLKAFDSADKARDLGLWEEYTRKFIFVHKLSTPAARRAWKTLDEAQKYAYRYLEDKKLTLREMREYWARAKKGSDSVADANDKERDYVEATERLQRVFVGELKDKLERLAEDEKDRPK